MQLEAGVALLAKCCVTGYIWTRSSRRWQITREEFEQLSEQVTK